MIASAKDDNPHYDPEHLLDTLQRVFSVRNDRQLAVKLDVHPSLLCKIRHRELDVPATLLIHLEEETNFSIRDLRRLMGDYRPHSGPSARHPTVEQVAQQRLVRVVKVPKHQADGQAA